MPAPNPPLVLIFGPFDPSGSSSLPADAVTCASLGCHPLAALTATLVQDTAGIEDIQPLSAELIDDQARCLLEDMNVQAIKVGPVYTPEAVSVLAQIAADYNHVPLVLHLAPTPDESLLQDLDAETLQLAILDLLLPQTDIVVADHHLLEQWDAQGVLAHAGTPAQSLLQYGATWVLSTGAPLRPGHGSHLLQGPGNETASWSWQPPATRLADPDGPLACAITAQLALGRTVPQAVEAAIAAAAPLATRTFQPGMGQRLINRSAP
ncbi:bifunctional hydroxymethylpyrimidine kinase/phosphomethylpyrimidine kinase [Alcaligenaceae bacterium]|nr:bifunctional hydroxymethylpyrimidine kinase/phosphomethylpyrimidine kinase [Alcaligenaceae bacterium]